MSKNPFTSVSDVTRKLGKNYYDWSHDYNFTGKIGTIYPVFAKYCPAGQSLSIDAQAGLQFMPMQFPVQSKMKLKLSFWRMPLRAMWKDYTNLVSSQNQPDVQSNYVAPYIDFNHSDAYTDMLAVGGLCDYLRIPVTLSLPAHHYAFDPVYVKSGFPIYEGAVCSTWAPGSVLSKTRYATPAASCSSPTRAAFGVLYAPPSETPVPELSSSSNKISLTFDFGTFEERNNFNSCVNQNISESKVATSYYDESSNSFTISSIYKCIGSHLVSNEKRVVVDFVYASGSLKYDRSQSLALLLGFPNSSFTFSIPSTPSSTDTFFKAEFVTFECDVPSSLKLTRETSPYFDSSASDQNQRLKLSAYPFRMYEAIYNAYIRYIRNNPFKKDGKAVYNEWLPTMEGGADKTPYKLYRCNWAADAYTTAVQSPQQGVAPVVGLSQATVTGDDGVSRVVPAITTEDGKTYGIEFQANEFGLENVDYTELGTGAKVAPVHSMYSLAQSGISIEDFRMTNAYQRYLELNMMRGYSYKQIVEGRFEVNVKYDDLLMPEFCGGMTRDVYVSGVQQNVEDNGGSGTYVGSLGSEAGVAGCAGNLGHRVKIYCDEPSYVMVLAYVVPQSIYSQVCPKDFLYRDLLDAWSPEFDQIGFQPIKFSEIAPVQTWNISKSALDGTFGFQRPWYENCEVLDASVGLFNTELRNFLMHRVFSGIPQLSQAFTTVNSESVDHVFSVTEFTDKFFGQIHFSIDVKSPVSRVVIPSLE